MPIFGLYTAKELNAKFNELELTRQRPHGSGRSTLAKDIKVEQLDRAKADVDLWRDALDEWESDTIPDRYSMMRLYQEIELDDEVTNHLGTITKSIAGTEFEIGMLDDEGSIEDDPGLHKLFKGKWFRKLIRLVLDAEMQGFTLVEIEPPKPGAATYHQDQIVCLPRELVWPERGVIRRRPQVHMDAIDYTPAKFSRRLLQLGDTHEKGLFNNMALLYIYKKNARAFWASFQSKFGIPPIVAKTDLENSTSVNTLVEFLEQMRSNTYAIVGLDDEITPLPISNTDAFGTFDKMIERMDQAISKVMEGQTMTSSDGSSYSQANVHQKTKQEHYIDRLRMVEIEVNEQLLPIIERDFPGTPAGATFRFKEVKDIDEILSRAALLKQAGYTIEQEYLTQLTGYPLEPAASPAPAVPKSLVNQINQLYNDL